MLHSVRIFMILFATCLFIYNSHAETINDVYTSKDSQTIEEILEQNNKTTNCASQIFSEALIKHSGEITEENTEFQVRTWAREAMTGDAEILKEILNCPELQHIADDTTVVFNPISYEFPHGRTLTINYSTQPKVLKQKLMLANKRSLPNGDVNPRLMDPNDPAKYLNTEPSWYAIMVVQHDSLKDFVGPGKNDTLSMKYLNDHIDEIYPHGYYCTSKSAIANDKDTINQVVHEVVKVEDDNNDYYVAGDVNLEWVMYAEIAADILITIFTGGTSQAVMGSLKGFRAAKTAAQLAKNANKLKKLPHVAKYAKAANHISAVTRNAERLEKNIKNAKKYERALKNLEKAKRANKTTDIAKYQKEADDILQAAKKIDPSITDDILKNSKNMETEAKKLKDSIPGLEKELKNSRKTDFTSKELKDIDNYTENSKYLEELLKYRGELRALQRPQTGNIVTRNLKKIGAFGKALKASNSGAKTMKAASKAARAGMSSFSSKAKYWLADATLKHGARLARFTRDASLLYGAISFLGDMYDKTSTTSKEFSNGIEFKPFCLLSADDLEGQDNVVNYGMWLMWTGNSADSADDDAAYLQAMDFASKFYYQLDEFQDENGANCNVDIYVVHPIIRLDETNVNDPKGELFYLFMNEIPWSTADQFSSQVSNIEDWERVQSTLDQQDPNNKYKRQNDTDSEQTQEQIAVQE